MRGCPPINSRSPLASLKLLIWFVPCFFLLSIAWSEENGPWTWAKKIDHSRVKNLFWVDHDLYRAAQPDHEAMLELEKMGIKTVLNLRNFHDDSKAAEGTKMKLLEVPINTWEISDEEISQALSIMMDKRNYPLLVHCLHGADRTGTVMAMYRIVVQNWPKEEALRELTEGGFGYHPLWTNIPKYIRGVDVKAFRERIKLIENK